jgi:dihydrofolate reductase
VGKLFAQMSVSIDGFIENRVGGMDWFAGDAAFDELLTSTVRSIDGIIFGRKAHELGAEYWPTAGLSAEDADVAEQIALMNTLTKYVLTRGSLQSSWGNSKPIGVDDIPRLKASAQRPLALFAGARAFQAVLEAGHIDEIRLIQYPVVLGGGTPLFAAHGRRHQLTPVETRVLAGGPTLSRYAVTTDHASNDGGQVAR